MFPNSPPLELPLSSPKFSIPSLPPSTSSFFGIGADFSDSDIIVDGDIPDDSSMAISANLLAVATCNLVPTPTLDSSNDRLDVAFLLLEDTADAEEPPRRRKELPPPSPFVRSAEGASPQHAHSAT